jgi:peptide/nickel transport system permease protein
LLNYIFKKIAYASLVLWGVLSVVFFLFNVLPGDPARMMLDKRENLDQLTVIKQKYAFDRSLVEQYALYVNDVSPLSFHHNSRDSFTSLSSGKYQFSELFSIADYTLVLKIPYLRESFVRIGMPVSSLIESTFKNTLVLACASIGIALSLGLFLGVISALYKDTYVDKLILFTSVLGMSLPSFFSSIIIAWLFGFVFHQYTGLSMTGSLYEVDDYGRGSFLQIKNLILPAITLGIRPLSVIIQLCRNSLLEVLTMDYVRTATAKGLSKRIVIFKHTLRNALNPVVTAVSGWFASMLAGAVFVEYIFAWNGIGKEIVDSLNKMDLPVVMGSVLFIAFLFVVINIIVDIVYGLLDPRVRIS